MNAFKTAFTETPKKSAVQLGAEGTVLQPADSTAPQQENVNSFSSSSGFTSVSIFCPCQSHPGIQV